MKISDNEVSDKPVHICPFRVAPLDASPPLYAEGASSCVTDSTQILCFSFEKKLLATIVMNLETAEVLAHAILRNIKDYKKKRRRKSTNDCIKVTEEAIGIHPGG